MDARAILRLLVLAPILLLATCGRKPDAPAGKRMAGAWLVHASERGFDGTIYAARLDHLKKQGYDWLALAPEAWMVDVTRPGIDWGDRDDDLRSALRAARAAGFKVLLFPRIESPTFFRAEAPLWRGDLAMTTVLDWIAFHDNLETMLVHYAGLAAEEDVDLFSLGLEYRQSTVGYPERWRRLIASVRAAYAGPLTYSANWYREYEEIEFWDALDYIGVGAYFPIAERAGADRAAMEAGWKPVVDGLGDLSRRFARPVLLTEIGYPGHAEAGLRPWEWNERRTRRVDHEHQADCYRAFFAAFAGADYLAGSFIWRYEADPSTVRDWEYSPEGRPAEAVIRNAIKR